jgi:predicted ATPase/DNA-binding winged helix-turn-helix (wHTH) protein
MAEPVAVSAERTLSFGPFRLMPARRLVLDGENPIRLGSRALEILIALVERSGELVSKEELMARAWPGIHVVEGNLKFQVAALRRALGDGRDGRRYLEVSPGRGYRFVAATTTTEKPVTESPRATSSTQKHNLPARLGNLIGRAELVARLAENVSRRRLLTIVGAPGIGKTSVAIAVADRLVGAYQDGIWLVDLLRLADPTLAASLVAATVGVKVGSEDPLAGLVSGVREKRVLLVLDNCGHVVDTVARLVLGLLRGAPGVQILATSREPLQIEGEHVHRLRSLESPPASTPLGADAALRFAAVQLFVELAAASSGEFELNDEDAPIVGEICRKLDGIPLAIELAAARVGSLGVRGLSARLEHRMGLLTSGRRTAVAHHRTLRATLDWSYDQLTASEQIVFQRLGIFSGGFSLAASAAVASDATRPADETVELVLALVAKSLVVANVEGEEPRFSLLDSTRVYALEKLAATDEADAVARRHASYYADLFERAEDPGEVADDASALEIDNVREALSWAFGPGGDSAIGIRLAAASVSLWVSLSRLAECHGWNEKAVGSLDAAGLRGTRQEMVLQASVGRSLQFVKGATAAAGAALNRALELARQLGDAEYELRINHTQWVYHVRLGEVREMLALAWQVEGVATTIADPVAVQTADRMLGISYVCAGELAASRERLERMLAAPPPRSRRAYIRRFGFDQWVLARYALAQLLFLLGYPEQAAQAGRRAVEEGRELQHDVTLCGALAWAGSAISLRIGDFEASRRFAAELVDVSLRHSLADYQAFGTAIHAFLSLKDGASGSGVEPIRRALERWRAAKWHVYLTMSDFAEAVANAGHLDEMSEMLDETLDRAERNQELWALPEALRLKGELLLQAGAEPRAAEAYFDRSIALARAQGALAWELRTAMSIASLQRKQRRTEQARQVLHAAYARFTEGFETADLKRAKELLDELGGTRQRARLKAS